MTPTESILKFCDEAKVDADNAHREICGLASGKRKWEMCVPVQSTDSDMVLQKPLDNSSRAIEALREITEALKHYSKYIIDHNEDADTAIDALAKAAKILEGREALEKISGTKGEFEVKDRTRSC